MTVLSPHLDDAIFSCGCLIAAGRNANVLTVFAGLPSPEAALPEWDRAAGFGSAREAVLSRRHEDARALGQIGGHPLWLDLLDSQYLRSYTVEAIAARIEACQVLRESRTVVAPMGLFHSDHILAHAASLLLCWPALVMEGGRDAEDPAAEPQRWLFYEDAIYRRLPGLVQELACRLAGGGVGGDAGALCHGAIPAPEDGGGQGLREPAATIQRRADRRHWRARALLVADVRGAEPDMMYPAISVVVLTHNRRDSACAYAAPARCAARAAPHRGGRQRLDGRDLRHAGRVFPAVSCLRCRTNLGAAARNVGAEWAPTPYVAFLR
ncbi:PIG-L deacetylase family protein [Cupriavidus basilensis]